MGRTHPRISTPCELRQIAFKKKMNIESVKMDVMKKHAPRVLDVAKRIQKDINALMEIEADMKTESPGATLGVTELTINTVQIFVNGLRQNAERRLK